MATYASATNPFIKPNDGPDTTNCNGQKKQAQKKNAPGMAKSLSLLEELNKSKQEQAVAESLLLDLPAEANHRESLASSYLASDLEDETQNNFREPERTDLELLEERQSDLQTQMSLLEKDIDDEIALTCRSLVEQAAVISGEEQEAAIGPAPAGAQPPATSPQELLEPVELKESVNDNKKQEPVQDKAENREEEKDEEQEIERDRTNLDEEKEEEEEEEDGVEPNLALAARDAGTGTRRHQHIELIKKLRLQLKDLERYAHERGELERMPASVLLERQTVILDTLRKKLPHFSILADKDKIEKLELEELKRQADDEINNLIDPLITKEHLLNQLRTQLTDLEKYVSHLHGTIGITNGICPTTTAATTAGEINQTANCLCALHGCSSRPQAADLLTSPSSPSSSRSRSSSRSSTSAVDQTGTGRRGSILSSDSMPKTSRLIRSLMAQLICSDLKIQEAMRMEKNYSNNECMSHSNGEERKPRGPGEPPQGPPTKNVITTKPPQAQFHDGAAWTLHIDRVILATDSLTNIYTIAKEGESTGGGEASADKYHEKRSQHPPVDTSLVDSVVRRQLVPAMRDLLAYGLIDPSSLPPRSSSYVFSFFDPYYLLSSLTCLPGSGSHTATSQDLASATSGSLDKVHVWHVIADYFETRNEPAFRNSSIKTLSQSFNLTSTMDGPIKITSKQALLIAIDDIIERLARCKPNGPESHLKLFVYKALNQGKLATWIKIIFRNKSITRKYYHNFSFVCQTDKMDRFLWIIDALGKFEFKLNTDTEAMDQFVSAF